jgi:exopolyphosphatase/guanosine-5'-triphosphate,3'-diphosphate pyrophosphatase
VNPEAVKAEAAPLVTAWESEPHHTIHVARLAVTLFDGFVHRHGLGEEDRLLLEIAGVLHDIGWSRTHPDGKGHHKVSARMIREHPWTSLTWRQTEIVAETARYHRKSLPSEEHPDFKGLTEDDQQRVAWLSAFLRIGDGLDRRHIQRVQEVEVRDLGDGCRITAHSTWEAEPELAAAKKKADLLEKLIRCETVFAGTAK